MSKSTHTVLFVDDEVNILKAVQRLLRAEPWTVLTASRGAEALELLDRNPCQVVVTDQRMPEMSGVDLLSSVREREPEIVRMMLTGYTEMNVAVEAINRGEIYRLITKPWNDEELKATLRQAFDHYDLKHEIRRLNQLTREQNLKLQDMNRNLEGKVRERTKQLADKHHELRIAYIQTIRALAEAVDAKDAYTRGHSERVGVYASKMARELGLPRDMIERVSFQGTSFAPPPARFEAGTPHIAGAVGLAEAIRFVGRVGYEPMELQEQALLRKATESVSGIDGLRIIGTAAEKVGVLSFVIDGVHPHDLATLLDRDGVAVRAGLEGPVGMR